MPRSTVALTDDEGTVTDRFTYGAYGELLTHTGSSDTPFLYNGRDGILTEVNGLYYMRARYYAPEIKRFINADPKKGSIDSSKTLNLYAYVGGDPILYIDSSGEIAELGEKVLSFLNENFGATASIDAFGKTMMTCPQKSSR